MKPKSWSWGYAHIEKHKVGVIKEELQRLVRGGLDGVWVFHTLYRRRVASLAKRTHPIWTYGGRSDLDCVSPEDLPNDKI